MRTTLKSKHYLLFVVIFSLISLCNVYAQQEKSSKSESKKEFFAFGPKLSVNFTQTNSFHWITTEFVPGVDLGLFFRFNIARFYIQPEVSYVIRNHNVCGCRSPFGHDFTEKRETNHIAVPLLAGFKIIDFRFFKFRIFAGPEFNFGLHSITPFQVGLLAGLGFDIWRFTIDAGYSFLADTRFGLNNNIFKVGLGFKCF